MARAKSTLLTEKQDKYVEARLDGKSKNAAAKEAGYAQPPANIDKVPEVAKSLANMRDELSSATQIKRADVIDMLKEAYDMSKVMAEPSTMVSAAKEIGKMLGFYEPETIKIEMTHAQSNIKSKLLIMSDAELYELASGKARVINGECSEVH